MSTSVLSFRAIALLIVCMNLSISFAIPRSYTLLYTELKCDINPEYMANMSCEVIPLPQPSRINMEGQLIRAVKHPLFDITIDLDGPNKKSVRVFNVKDADLCQLAKNNSSITLLELFRGLLLKVGLDECPIPEDFHFKFQDFVMNTDVLPAVAPQANFKNSLALKDNKIRYCQIVLSGKVINLKNSKGHRILQRNKNQLADLSSINGRRRS